MNKTAFPYYRGNKRVMFEGCENFGPGSFDSASRMHSFSVAGGKIIPCTVNSIAKDKVSTRYTGKMVCSGILITVFEN